LRIAVDKNERVIRLARAKAIGGVAYRLVRDAKTEGFIELEGERKQI
jgi:hypothetical protein